jgi:hypothetical protein
MQLKLFFTDTRFTRSKAKLAKQKDKQGFFNVDQFCDWITGYKFPEVSYPSINNMQIQKLNNGKSNH